MKTIFIFFANPVVNIPPVINSGIALSNKGLSNLIIGYKTESTLKVESLSKGSKIFRIELKSRKIKFAPLRKLLSTVEFLIVAKYILNHKKPKITILFNEVAAIVGRFTKHVIQIHWALEFPENETKTLAEHIIKRLGYSSCKNANILVFPTMVRKAMGMVLNPGIKDKPIIVAHNAPLLSNGITKATEKKLGANAQVALDFMQKAVAKDQVVVVYAGAVGQRYGWDVLIQSIGAIEEKFVLLILGDKHDLGFREYNSAIAHCEYPENILWLDSIPYFEMQYVLKFAHMGFVHYIGDTLNTYFSAPGKLYEYLKAGLIVLTDEQACIANDLEVSNAALFFETPLRRENLIHILTHFPKDFINSHRQNAIELFKNKYSFENQIQPLIALIKNLQ